MSRSHATLRLTGLVAAEVGALVALHRLGGVRWLALPQDHWALWLATSAPGDVLAATLRIVALGCAWWLLGSTILYIAARASRVPRAIAAIEWATLPGVRRVADRAMAVALSTSAVLGSGGAAFAGEAAAPARPIAVATAAAAAAGSTGASDVVVPPGAARAVPPDLGALPTASDDPDVPAPLVAPPEQRAAGGPAPPEAVLGPGVLGPGVLGPGVLGPGVLGPGALGAYVPPRIVLLPDVPVPEPDAVPTHTVIDGEHLWGIAADVLAATRAVDPAALTDREIHAYWVSLIAANRPALRSGDPDLIHPGEVLQLPPVTEP